LNLHSDFASDIDDKKNISHLYLYAWNKHYLMIFKKTTHCYFVQF